MIGNVSRGSTFGGLQGYLLHGRAQEGETGLEEYLLDAKEGAKRVAWVSSRNLPTEDPRYAAVVMHATAAQNPRVEKPVYHLSLSADPGETLTREDWDKVIDRVLRDLDLHERQVLIVAHNDTKHPHVHLMVNRVHPETHKCWSDSHDYARIEKALRHIERDMKLREVPGHHYRLPGQEPPSREASATPGERRETERTGEPSFAEKIRFKVYEDLRQAKDWGELERRLARHSLRLERRGGGLVITDGKNRVKASRIYRRASYRSLEKRFGMSFDKWSTKSTELRGAVHRYLELERRKTDLGRERDRAWKKLSQATRDVEERERVRVACRRAAREVLGVLEDLYPAREVPAVQRRLAADARRRGWAAASRRLAEKPGRYGRPRPVLTLARRQRHILARRLVSTAGDLAVLRSARLLAGPAGFRGAAAALLAKRTWQRAARRHDGLPPSKTVLKEIAGRAIALGVSSVSLVLAPEPLKVVRLALRTAQLARAVGREMTR